MALWLNRKGHGYFPGDRRNLDVKPSPTICDHGLGTWIYWLEDDGREPMKTATDKPPYRVPSMDEIRAIPWNGLTVASTFSGCGGSCLGYRMAGYRVVWANEFVPAAQDSYNANKSDACILDTRDIRTVRAEEIRERLGIERGELDLFDGSPPCQAFSTAGHREKGWGRDKKYEHGAQQKNEQLFDDYIRLLDGLQPRAFVAENVTGLVKGTAKGMFLEILSGLKGCGYNVAAKVLDAQWLGVPQMRKRVIFIGTRRDLNTAPQFPSPLGYQYSVRDAIGDVYRVPILNPGKVRGTRSAAKPSPTVTTQGVSSTGASGRFVEVTPGQKRKFTIAEVRRICGFPDDFILTGSYSQQWERLGNSVPPVMMAKVAEVIRDRIMGTLDNGTQAKADEA